MRHHLAALRQGGVIALALLLTSSVGLLVAQAAPDSHQAPTAPTSHPARVTPDAAERRYTSCMLGVPTTPRGFEAWNKRCSERVAAGRL